MALRTAGFTADEFVEAKDEVEVEEDNEDVSDVIDEDGDEIGSPLVFSSAAELCDGLRVRGGRVFAVGDGDETAVAEEGTSSCKN